jgi:PAS domain S-box-containing protein/putative nucleotidyltransferase with HDIG domain
MSVQALAGRAQGETTPKDLRILLLEDVKMEADLVREELRRAEFRFTDKRVVHPENFVKALQEWQPDLILADYKLPGEFDGITALALAQDIAPDVPFILVSGQISEEMALEAVNGGATDYVFKNNLVRLVPSVHRALLEVREREQRRQAEEALKASELRHRLLVEHSHDAILQLDHQGHVVFANPATERIFGYSPEEFQANPRLVEKMLQSRSRHDYEEVRDEFEEQGTLTEGTLEWVWVRKDGQRVFTESVFTNLIDDQGKSIGFQLILRDISAQRRAAGELRQSFQKLRRTFGQTVQGLAHAVEKRDPYTGGHQERVAQLALAIAQAMDLPEDQSEGIFFTSLLHDIGKINIPSEILTKPGKLTEVEMMIIRTHPQVGYEILKDIDFPWPVADAVLQHHERINGSGYPAGLFGHDMLLEAKILAVADVTESMASHRPYRPAHGLEKALVELTCQRDVLFNPAVVDACLAVFDSGQFEFRGNNVGLIWNGELANGESENDGAG